MTGNYDIVILPGGMGPEIARILVDSHLHETQRLIDNTNARTHTGDIHGMISSSNIIGQLNTRRQELLGGKKRSMLKKATSGRLRIFPSSRCPQLPRPSLRSALLLV
ncbi:hypothetical protein BDW62DRAFT_189314 [Aspergillus aurantiobrunneus]